MNKLAQFSVSIYGKPEKYSDVISKARCRVFYKYGNRNGSYITDEFAEKLLSTIAYAPVKGIYKSEEADYTDHGEKRTEGRIYGIVPENPNLAWEEHLDEDGVTRTYACVDVLIYTGIYGNEAYQIIGKSQSMELYGKSITGDWQYINGKRYYVYSDACFLGLQVLGDEVEPCFEGAAFFSKLDDLQKVLDAINKISNTFEVQEGAGKIMNFRLSDNKKYNMLWSLLNLYYNEDDGWISDYAITEVYDDYALAYKYEDQSNYRVYYTKNDEEDSLAITSIEKCFVIDVTEAEYNALKTLRALNNDTYEKIDEEFSQINVLKENNLTYSQQVQDLNTTIADLHAEVNTAAENYSALQNSLTETTEALEAAKSQLSSLTTDYKELVEYKKNIETAEKNAIIESYSSKLDEDVLDVYRRSCEKFSIIELKKELAYEYVEANPIVPESYSRRVPQQEPNLSGLEAILSKYKKNNKEDS